MNKEVWIYRIDVDSWAIGILRDRRPRFYERTGEATAKVLVALDAIGYRTLLDPIAIQRFVKPEE